MPRQAGHDVWEAADGAQAAAVQAHEPELLILEIWMPILNGLEVLERLVGAPEAAGIKVVMLSKECDADTRLEGFALGVVDYWPRDMPVAELRERIDRVLCRSRRRLTNRYRREAGRDFRTCLSFLDLNDK